LRTTRFANGAEKVRKITLTKPDAMAARKKTRKKTDPSTRDLDQNEDVLTYAPYYARGCCQPLLLILG
jgi:hypothetical protein